MNRILIGGVCMFLIVLMPLVNAQLFDLAYDTGAEDIVVGVKDYEPTVLVSSLLEDGDVPVFVNLFAYSSNPLLEVQDIESFNVYETSGDTSFVRSIKHRKPTAYSFEDLGYLEVWLKKIEREKDMPGKIRVNMTAKVNFDVDSIYLGGQNQRSISEMSKGEFESNLNDHSFFGGKLYVWARKIEDNGVSFEVYNNNVERIIPVTLLEGQESAPFFTSRGSLLEEDKVRLKLDRIRGAGGIVTIDTEDYKSGDFVKKEKIDSEWYVDRIHTGDKYVVLHKQGFTRTILLEGVDFNALDKGNISLKYKETFEETGKWADIKKWLAERSSYFATLLDSGVSTDDDFIDALVDALGQLQTDFDGRIPELNRIRSLERKDVVGAKLNVGYTSPEVYYEGDVLVEEVERCKGQLYSQCVVKEIKLESDNKVNVALNVPSQRNCATFEEVISYPGNGILDSEACGSEIVLEGFATGSVADITVSAGSGKSVSTSTFSVVIPIEKRKLFNHTDEELDKKINKTRERIEKLNKTINELNEIVTGWSYACTATAALFTVGSFFRGFGAGTKSANGTSAVTLKDKNAIEERGERVPLDQGQYLSVSDWPIYIDLKTNKSFEMRSRDQLVVGNFRPYSVGVFYERSQKNVNIADRTYYRYDETTGNITEVGSDKKYLQSIKIGVDDKERVTIIPATSDHNFLAGLVDYQDLDKTLPIIYGNVYYQVKYDAEVIEIWSAGDDARVGSDDDTYIMDITGGDYEYLKTGRRSGRLESPRVIGTLDKMNAEIKKGDKTFKIAGLEYDTVPDAAYQKREPEVECKDVLGEGKCRILFNACDPVICPPSRFDLKGKYRVENVIQSGFVGSIFLGLHNFPETLVPICLTGVLAALRNLQTNFQAYESCLVAAKIEGKSIGICNTINSIYLCELLWKEIYNFFKLKGGVIGTLIEKAGGRGGGEYIVGGIQGGIEESKKTLNFFTQDYASNAFAAYRGRSSQEIGTEVCKSAIYGKIPGIGDLFEQASTPENPPQFTAYMQEYPYSPTTRQSRYQVYYHIYAGTQTVERVGLEGLRYAVFLKGGSLPTKYVTDGLERLEFGQFVDEAEDFIAPTGYQEVCVQIDDSVECGFGKIVSSSFFLNQVGDYIVTNDLSRNIKSASQCRSEPIGGLVPNVQIERRCSKDNPNIGLGGTKENEWVEVGDCGVDVEGNDLGTCWVHIGDLKNSRSGLKNPSLIRESFEDICAKQGGEVCGANQICASSGELFFDDTVTIEGGSVDVVCCSLGSCIDQTEGLVVNKFLNSGYGLVNKETGWDATKTTTLSSAIGGDFDTSADPALSDIKANHPHVYWAFKILNDVHNGNCEEAWKTWDAESVNIGRGNDLYTLVDNTLKYCPREGYLGDGPAIGVPEPGVQLEGINLIYENIKIPVSGVGANVIKDGVYDIEIDFREEVDRCDINLAGAFFSKVDDRGRLTSDGKKCMGQFTLEQEAGLKIQIKILKGTEEETKEYALTFDSPKSSPDAILLCTVERNDVRFFFCNSKNTKSCNDFKLAGSDNKAEAIWGEDGQAITFGPTSDLSVIANCRATCTERANSEGGSCPETADPVAGPATAELLFIPV